MLIDDALTLPYPLNEDASWMWEAPTDEVKNRYLA